MEKRLTTASSQFDTDKEKSYKRIIVVWLGKNSSNQQEKSLMSNIKEQAKQMEVFDDTDVCIDYITSLEDEAVLLIVSHIFSGTIMSLIYEISSIAAVYICCETCLAYETVNDESYKKVAGIFNTQDQLASAIRSCTKDNDACSRFVPTFVWLGKITNNEQEESIITSIKEQVKKMEVFDDKDVCIDYISSLEDDAVLLIVSHIFGEALMPLIYEISSIAAVYIYCETCLAYECMNDKSYKKIAGIFGTQNQLTLAVHDYAKDNETSANSNSIIQKNMCITTDSSNGPEIKFSIIDDSYVSSYKMLYEISSKFDSNTAYDDSIEKQLDIRDFEFIWLDTSVYEVDIVFQNFSFKSWVSYQNAVECFTYISQNHHKVLFLVTSASSAEILFSLLEIKECVSLHMYVYSVNTDISSRSNWMKTFSNNIRGLYCNTDDLSQQLASDAIKFYIEVANLAVNLREELHTLAAICYKKSIDLLEIYSHDKALQLTIFEKLKATINTLQMSKDHDRKSEHKRKTFDAFMFPGVKQWFDGSMERRPDFDEYIMKCPPVDVMNQINYSFILLDGQSQDSQAELINELILPKNCLRLKSVIEYLNHIISADNDNDQTDIILMSQTMSDSFFDLLNEFSRPCIILIYDDEKQIYLNYENSYFTSSSTPPMIIRCNNIQTARKCILTIIAMQLINFGDKCNLTGETKRLAKEYYRKALEKLNNFDNFMEQNTIQEVVKKFNTPINPIKEIYGVEQATKESHLLYIKIFGASFLQQQTFSHKECTLFAKISLQTWGTDQFQDWSGIVDSACTRDEINTMDPMWNEGFLFRVHPTKQRLMIEIYNVDRYFKEAIVSVCLIELNTEIPTESTTNVIRKRRCQLYQCSAEFRVTGLATIGLLYVNSSNFKLQDEHSEMENAIVSHRVYDNWIRGGFLSVFDRPGIMAGSNNLFFNESCTVLFADENSIPDEIEEITVILLADRFNCSVQSHTLIHEIKLLHCHLEFFDSTHDLKNYISAVNNEKMILIVTDYFSELIFGLIDDLFAIPFIYILTTENRTHYHASWITNYSNVRGAFDDTKFIISKITQDISMLVENKEHSNVFESITQMNMATTRNIYAKQLQSKCFHLLLEILVQTTPESCTAKKKMAQYSRAVNSCGEFNKNNEKHLELVDEFENDYTAGTALRWYTRESFIYRLLNRILRTNNVDAILDFGFYIADLHNGLKKLCSIQSQSYDTADVHVYRGQYMKPDELRNIQLNVGGVIAINTFFSASSKLDVAIANSGAGSQRPLFESVLFDIQINKEDAKFHIFAKIAKESEHEYEDETLFTFGTSFHVNSVFFSDENEVWIIKLTMSNRKEQHLNDRFDVILLHLVDILRHVSSKTHTISQKMLNRCRQYCASNEVELKKLDEFEAKYRSDDAVRWYTKDSILFRLLNRALRSEDAEIVLDFRCFILDLYHQLDRIHTDFDRHTLDSQSYTVFRGQQITMKEINRLKRNINGYIVIKTFLSTSLSKPVAMIFAGKGTQNPVSESMLFIIDVSAHIQCLNAEKPFANIQQHGHFKDEEEVLFIPGTIFRLNAITKSANEGWTAHLTLYTGNDEELNKLNNYQKLILSLAKRRQIKITATNNQLHE